MLHDDDLSENEIRRIYVSDENWSRVHPSWKALKPRKNFNEFREDDESIVDYCARIGFEFGFAHDVLAQWMYGLFYNDQTIRNYAWIDFGRVAFLKERWSSERFLTLRVIEDFAPYVTSRSVGHRALDDFCCTSRDREWWRDHGTWRVPPIAIDASTLADVPEHSDIVGRFQLVEGHSRLGYLRVLARIGEHDGVRLADEHDVYVLTVI